MKKNIYVSYDFVHIMHVMDTNVTKFRHLLTSAVSKMISRRKSIHLNGDFNWHYAEKLVLLEVFNHKWSLSCQYSSLPYIFAFFYKLLHFAKYMKLMIIAIY